MFSSKEEYVRQSPKKISRSQESTMLVDVSLTFNP